MKIAFFDIDKTLIYGDSLFSLLKYGIKKRPVYVLLYPVIGVFALLYALRLIPITRLKEIVYTPLKDFTKEDYEIFFEKYIWGKRIQTTVNELTRLKSEGYYILMVTASAQCYMRLWEEKGFAHRVLGTLTKEGSNKIIGNNCSGAQKVKRIEKFFKENGFENEFEDAIGFSDSNKDKPMLSLCNKRVRVLKNGSHTEFIM